MSYTLAYQGAEIDDILARAVPGGAIDQALATKQDALTFDAVPTEGSTNPAESGGIYDAIQAGGAAALAAFATDSVSGDVASFPDGASNIPVKAFAGSILPQQNLNGQSAPYPAGGGKNKFNEDSLVAGDYDGTSGSIRCHADAITLTSGQTVTVSAQSAGTIKVFARFGDSHAVVISGTFPQTYTASANGDIVFIFGRTDNSALTPADVKAIKVQVEFGSSPTAYAPYANVCPISGWTGANITRAGKNILDMTVGSWSSGIIAADGTITPNGAYHYMTDSRPIKGGTDYAFGVTKDTSSAVGFAVSFYDEDDNFISTNVVVPAATTTGRRTATFTTPSGTARYRLRCPVESPQITSYQIEEGSTATDYEAYQADTILLDFGQTVYAGTLTALGGGLWKIQPTHAYRELTGTESFSTYSSVPNSVSLALTGVTPNIKASADIISDRYKHQSISAGDGINVGSSALYIRDTVNCANATGYKAYLAAQYAAGTPVQICYELATLPDPITITGEDLQTLLGANTVWTDVGAVTGMTYRADTALYIDKKLGA